jgi:hypothetical protein
MPVPERRACLGISSRVAAYLAAADTVTNSSGLEFDGADAIVGRIDDSPIASTAWARGSDSAT